MTLQQIQICDHLSMLGSINAVARRLGVTQPAISTALSQLERELHVRLFTRSKRGVQPTRKGKELLPYFKEIMKMESGIYKSSHVLPPDSGSIKIAGRQGFMQYVFPSLHRILTKQFPAIKVESLVSGDQPEVIEALSTGRVDLAFASSPKMKSIRSEVIFTDPVFIGISRKRKNEIAKTRLKEIEFCLPTRSDRLRKPLEQMIKSVITKPQITLESDDYTVLCKLVAGGEFAGPIYGHMLLDRDVRESVVPIPNFKPILHRELTVLYRRDDLLPHIETVKDLFRIETHRLLSSIIKRSLNRHIL